MGTVLAILGSPRKNGNVATLLNIAVEQSKKEGHKVEFINVYEKKINNCIGCMKCRKTGSCYMDDDMVEIEKYFINSDYFILACPTYWANIPGAVKNMFDRLVGVFMDDNNSMIPKSKFSSSKKYILITACNTPFPFNYLAGQSRSTIKNMYEILHTSGMKKHGTVVFAGARNFDKIPQKYKKRVIDLIKTLK